MTRRLTDQAAVAVLVARTVADPGGPTVAHLLIGLATEPDGRAGRRLRERASAAAVLLERGSTTPAPPMADAINRAGAGGTRAATTVDLLDAAIACGGPDVDDLLVAAGYHRDLDGWLAGDPESSWFEDAETYGLQPAGDSTFDEVAGRVVAQVRAVDGGGVEVLIAAAAAPDVDVIAADPSDLAGVAARLGGAHERPGDRAWDAGLDAVVSAAQTLRDGPAVTVRDLVRAALVAGGDAPRLVLELAGGPA